MIKPIGDRVVIRPDKTEEVSAGGIARPDIGQEKPVQGEVLAVGMGDMHWNDAGGWVHRPLGVQVGDHVLYGKFSGTELLIDGETVLIMREDEILGVL